MTDSYGDDCDAPASDRQVSAEQPSAGKPSEPPPWPWERAADGEDVPASVPLEEIRSGGPPDGIPPIDDPKFEDTVVAGEPLVVTYCPLCNSGLVFERTVDGEVLDFGTSGRLWNSNLVMYDRATRDTGVSRPYGTNPYAQYDSAESRLLFDGDTKYRWCKWRV